MEKKLVSFFEFVTFFLSSSSFSRGKACDPWNEIGREGERERRGRVGEGGGKEITNVVSGRMESFARADAFIVFITSVGNHE